MKPDDFISHYEKALGTQDWGNIEPLMHDNVSVTFSNGKVHLGKQNVQMAFENNFSIIRNEEYKISNVEWLIKEVNFAVYLFKFNWKGMVNGKSVAGSGVGTSVIVEDNSTWKLITEHLGKQ